MATILFNPGIPEAGLRFETDPQVITNLQNTAPPWVIVTQVDVPPPVADPGFRVDPGEPIFDPVALTYTNTWVITELPPDYAGLQSMIGDSALMDRVTNRLTPVEVITTHRNGRAQSGGSNFIVLAEAASDVDGAYLGSVMLVPQGTGLNNAFICIGYTGATRQADLVRISGNGAAFVLDGTTRYRMYPLEAMHAVAVDAAGVWTIERTTRRFMSVLERMVSLYESDGFNPAPGDNANIVARFQDRLNAWVAAVNFNAEDRATLAGYLGEFVPTRGYTVP
jgi:hypothetical protein